MRKGEWMWRRYLVLAHVDHSRERLAESVQGTLVVFGDVLRAGSAKADGWSAISDFGTDDWVVTFLKGGPIGMLVRNDKR